MKKLSFLLKRKLFWATAVIFVICIAIYILATLPAQGVVKNKISSSDVQAMLKQTSPDSEKERTLKRIEKVVKEGEAQTTNSQNTYESDLFSFSYPHSFTLKTHQTGANGTLEQLIFTASSPISQVISITLARSNANSLADVSAIQFRRLKKDIYSEKPLVINNKSGLAFSSTTDGFEKIGFFLDKGILTTLVFSSYASANQSGEFDKIFHTFIWK